MDDLTIFEKMTRTLQEKQSWHYDRRILYDGLHKAPMVRISKDPKITAYASKLLGWPGKAVDYLIADCHFEMFAGDEFGATRLLVESGGDKAILSAEKNAAIGAVSFVAIFPREDGRHIPVAYTGAEATGIMNARGDELEYGLAVKKTEAGQAIEWYLFEKGAIHVVNSLGEKIDSIDLGVNVMPFVQFTYDQDSAARPFGRSRLSQTSISILDDGLRARGLQSMVSKLNIVRSDIMAIKGTPEDIQTEQVDSEAGEYKIIWMDTQDGVQGFKMERSSEVSSKGTDDEFRSAAEQFAAEMSMLPTTFGVQPTNGSFSAETLAEMKQPYTNTKASVRLGFGESIRKLAIVLYQITAQTENVEGLRSLQPVFKENVGSSSISGIGDAMGKISAQFDAKGIEVPDWIWMQMVGFPTRQLVMDQALPDFEASKRRFRELKF